MRHSSIDAAEKRADYQNGCIDLLYFNDFRSGDYLNKVLELWRDKLSDEAVVIIHNTNWISEECDVHVFWNKLQFSGIPSFNFLHSHGLGVLLIGKHCNNLLLQLSDADTSNDTWTRYSHKFQQAGQLLEINCQRISLEHRLDLLHNALSDIKDSKSWKLTQPLRKLLNILS